MINRTDEPIRVGVVGANPAMSWAAAAHLPALAHLDEFTVTAVGTTKQATADAAAAAFGARHAFADAHELASHPDVDLVVVSVRPDGRAGVIRAALAAGKHVFCEWPLGTDSAEAAELAEAAVAAGVVHAIGLQGCHSPSARYVKDLIAEGRIGRIESASIIAPGDPWGGSRIPQALAWGTDPATGAGLLNIMAGHTLAVLEYLAGELTEVSAVVANLNDQVLVTETGARIPNRAPGQVALAGRLDSGAVASLTVHGGNSTSGPDGFLLRLAGTEGTITVTAAQPGMYVGWADWDIRMRSADDGATRDLPVPRRYRTIPDGVPGGPPANVAALYREIARAIADGTGAEPSFTTAARHHRLLDAIERASLTGIRQTTAAQGASADPTEAVLS
jgi:predicted dehydrogenase